MLTSYLAVRVGNRLRLGRASLPQLDGEHRQGPNRHKFALPVL